MALSDVTDDLEDLERKMRAKLGPLVVKPKALPAAELRMVSAVVGRNNAERLAKHDGSRRFRPAAVVTYFEFYWTKPAEWQLYHTWHVNKVENGRPEEYASGTDVGELKALIASLRKKGATCREIQMGFQRRNADRTPESYRKAILQQIGSFRA